MAEAAPDHTRLRLLFQSEHFPSIAKSTACRRNQLDASAILARTSTWCGSLKAKHNDLKNEQHA